MISVTFDWLTLTTKVIGEGYFNPVDAVLLPLRPAGLFIEYEDAPPTRFYKRAVRCSRTGATAYWDNVSSAAAASLVLTGSDCHTIGDETVSGIITKLSELPFEATRIDVAVTFVGEPAAKQTFDTLPSVLTVVKARRKVSVLKDNRGYVTCTVGSRTSSYYLRVYNRPKVQYHGNPDSFRVELEIKGEAASKLFRRHSPEGIKALAVRKAASMLQPYSPALSSLLLQSADAGFASLPTLGRRGAIDPADWYRSQVGPALMKLMRENYVKYEEVKRYLLDILT